MIRILRAAFVTAALLPAIAAAQVTFGSTLTLSGSGSAVGQNAREGMELAKEEVNNSGGIGGKELVIKYEDFGEVDLKRAVSAAQKFLDIDHAVALLPMITEDAEVVWPIAKKQAITMAIYAGGRELTKGKEFMFQVSSSDAVFGRTLADYAIEKEIESICLLTEQGAYAVSIGKFTAEYWKSRTGRDAVYLEYAPETADFKPLLIKMQRSGCGAVVFLTSINKQGTALRQLDSLGWEPLKLGLDVSEDPNIVNIAKQGIDGLVYVKYLVATPEFAEKFKAKYGHEIGFPAALAYDAVTLLAKIMRERGTAKEAVSKALFEVKDYPGASGPLTIDADGTRHDRVPALWTFIAGKPQPLR